MTESEWRERLDRAMDGRDRALAMAEKYSGQIGELSAIAAMLRCERDDAAKDLAEALSWLRMIDPTCRDLHHSPSERHDDYDCPVMERFRCFMRASDRESAP
jgi:hypothetical protein